MSYFDSKEYTEDRETAVEAGLNAVETTQFLMECSALYEQAQSSEPDTYAGMTPEQATEAFFERYV